ncbi:MAG: trigger factor [Firmicutes bacterium]|nr:trigger factor [Clostridiales bacterium]MBQ9931175.1 trigger factor [Bacillota bacterium]
MKAVFVKRENNVTTFTMEFTAEDFEEAIVQSYKANKGKYQIPGFRKGKAPRKMIENYYGEGVFYEDAVDNMINKNYPAALIELKVEPVDRPSIDFDDIKKEGFTITVNVTVKPEVEVKGYMDIKIEKQEVNVTDEDVQNDLEAMQRRNGRMVLVERAAKEGDTVLIDYTGYLEENMEEPFEGGSMERQPLVLGSGHFIPGFEDQIVGAEAGAELDVKVTFPEEYHAENLAGKPAVFKVKVHEIKETELPALDDDFAAEVSEFDTLDELKASIREKLEKNAADKIEYEGKNLVIEKLMEANEVDIPAVMIEDQIDMNIQEMDQNFRYQGLTLEMYLGYLQQDMATFRETVRPDAEKRVKSRLLLEALADQEDFTATNEDLDNEISGMAEQYNMELDKLKMVLGGENMEYMLKDIKMRKAVDFLYENATK